MKDTDIAWSAGLLEGEGCFMIQNGNCPVVTCEMIDLDVLEKLKNIYGGSILYCGKRQEHHKESWRWVVRWANAIKVIELIKPFMHSRRSSKINEVLAMYENKKSIKFEQNQKVLEAAKRYINGEGSLRNIAKDYNFSYEVIRRTARRISEDSARTAAI